MQRKNLRPLATMNMTEKEQTHCDDEGKCGVVFTMLHVTCHILHIMENTKQLVKVTVWVWIWTGTSPAGGARDTTALCWRAASRGAQSTRDLTVRLTVLGGRLKYFLTAALSEPETIAIHKHLEGIAKNVLLGKEKLFRKKGIKCLN